MLKFETACEYCHVKKADLWGGGVISDVHGSSRMVFVNTRNFGWMAVSPLQVSLPALCKL